MEQIKVNGILILELQSKQDWVNKVPSQLPSKSRGAENYLWVDKNGNVFECGADFKAAEEQSSYPCKVYKLQNVSSLK